MRSSAPFSLSLASGRWSDLATGLVLAGAATSLGAVAPAPQALAWAGLVVVVCIRLMDTKDGRTGAFALAGPLLLWAVVLWCLGRGDRWFGRETVLGLGGIALWVWVGATARRDRLTKGILALALAGGLGCAAWQAWVQPGWLPWGVAQVPQYFSRPSGFFGNPNQWAAWLLLLLPLCLAHAADPMRARRERVLAAYLAGGALLALIAAQSRGAWLALVVVAVVALVRTARARWIPFGAAVVLVPLLAFAPLRERLLLALEQGGESARSVIWRAAFTLLRETPWLGTGPGGFASGFERLRPAGFVDQPVWVHSEPLQIAVETGLIGLGLGGLGVVLFWIQGRRRLRTGVDRALGWGLVAFALACAVDFHAQIPGTAWLAGWFAGRWWRGEGELQANLLLVGAYQKCMRVGLGVGVAALAWLAWTRWEVECGLGQERRVRREVLGKVPQDDRVLQASLARLQTLASSHPTAWPVSVDVARLQYTRARLGGDRRALGAVGVESARRGVAMAPHQAETWLWLGVSLGVAGRREEAGAAFQEALSRAPRSASLWYHFAFFLADQPGAQKLALVAIENCLHLDPNHREAQALHLKLSSPQ